MVDVPAPPRPASRRLLDLLKSWLPAWVAQSGRAANGHATPGVAPEAPRRDSVRVLVVDDNPVNLTLISAMLESRGIVPLLAADGAEAVVLACESRLDLVLMDLQMPVLDGLEATALIRHFERASPWPAVPVVAFSMTVPDDGVLASHGLNGRLRKPCAERDLDACLVRWCPGYRPAHAALDGTRSAAGRPPVRRPPGVGREAP